MWKCQVIFIACEVTRGGAGEERERGREGLRDGGRASKEEEEEAAAAAARHSFYIHGGDSGRGERGRATINPPAWKSGGKCHVMSSNGAPNRVDTQEYRLPGL